MNMIYVIGFGAVGSTLTAYLLAAGRKPIVVARREKITGLRSHERLHVERSGAPSGMVLPAPDTTADPDYSDASHVFICTKRAQLPQALESLKGRLPVTARVLACVNGVGAEEEILAVLPGQPCSTVSVMANMRVISPMRVRLTTAPELIITHADKTTLNLFAGTGMKVQAAGPGSIWGKLLINLNNAICALCNRGFADIFQDEYMRKAYVAALDEAAALLEAAGEPFTMPAPVSYKVYRWVLDRYPGIPLWVARRKNGLSDEAFPSMCADLQAGRETEVRYLNGAVVELAQRLDRPAPVNSGLMRLIEDRRDQPAPPPLEPKALCKELGLI